MSQKRKLGALLIGVGIVVFLISIFADPLGIGGYPGFGTKQVIGTIIGVVLAIIGVILYRK